MLKKILLILGIIGILFSLFCVWWYFYLVKAHSTFENYYNFRGCTELVERTDNYGICKLGNGEIVKIVLFDNSWFLDGDLPCGFLCF